MKRFEEKGELLDKPDTEVETYTGRPDTIESRKELLLRRLKLNKKIQQTQRR
ncbi:hypothetical protein GF354_04095 [Candidatus Peregrinibacteria bacterium]|nr:hypothetical protein [Candidatus Peregrinibacteria bacterium]